jgi:hypothetical protein
MGDTQPDEPSPAPAALPSTQCDDDGLDGGTEDDEVSPESGAPKPAWGQLRAASGDALVLEMDGGPYTLGRAESCTLRLTDNKVSGVHARLSHDGANAILEDLSSNGTFVNGTKVGKGRLRVLLDDDEIAIVAPSVASDSSTKFRFVLLAGAAAEATSAAVAAAATAAAAGISSAAAPSAAAASGAGASSGAGSATMVAASSSAASGSASVDDGSALEKELMCGICQDLMHRPVALQPCMHSFCGACFSEWMKRKIECPQCRQPVRVVSRNHALANIVDMYLSTHPDKRRDPEELARLDKEDTLGNQPKQLRKRDRADGGELGELSDDDDDDDDGEGEDEDDDDYDGLPPGYLMAQMLLMQQQMRRAQRTPCAQCRHPTETHLMSPLRTRRPPVLTTSALGNGFERDVLTTYLSGKGKGIADLYIECLARAEAGTMIVRDIVGMVPGVAVSDLDGPTCHRCFEQIFDALVFQYRAELPAADLPDAVTRRSDCWHGIGCRTQIHNRQHAERLNHICQPLPPADGRGGGGGGGRSGGGRGGSGRGGGGAAAPAAAAGGGAHAGGAADV